MQRLSSEIMLLDAIAISQTRRSTLDSSRPPPPTPPALYPLLFLLLVYHYHPLLSTLLLSDLLSPRSPNSCIAPSRTTRRAHRPGAASQSHLPDPKLSFTPSYRLARADIDPHFLSHVSMLPLPSLSLFP